MKALPRVGCTSAYDFMINKICQSGDRTGTACPCAVFCFRSGYRCEDRRCCCPAYLIHGYDNNRLSNDMDTSVLCQNWHWIQSSPFFNKATQQTTAPGSTLKLLSTIAGMMEGVIDDGHLYMSVPVPSIMVASGDLLLEPTGVTDRS
ncbi:MAG: penicillin-binding transpeptidase domain-containing protein [Gallintestinimicrobium sp.]